MQPLLSIQTLPIEISYSTKRAELRQSTPQPRAEVNRVRGKADIRTEPARIQMDSYEMRASIGIKTAPRVIQESAQAGRANAAKVTNAYAESKNTIRDSYGNKAQALVQIAMSKVMNTTETIMSFMPSARPEMWMEGGTIDFDYTMDQLDYNWNVHVRPEAEFVPGGVEFNVSQYPQVVIEYLGSPHYVPPSADPNYEPLPELNQVV